MSNRIRLTTYLAGGIEHCSNTEMKSWRQTIREKLTSRELGVYDPVEQESYKVGKLSGEQVQYITGLKSAGLWDKFFSEMWKIWFANISVNKDLLDVFRELRTRKHIDGNRTEEFKTWGDYEAVLKSDFIICYMPKDIRTIGTIYEVFLASLFRIPIYLILPDCSKKDTNSSLLFGIMISDGEIFYSINEACNYIIDKYKLTKKNIGVT